MKTKYCLSYYWYRKNNIKSTVSHIIGCIETKNTKNSISIIIVTERKNVLLIKIL